MEKLRVLFVGNSHTFFNDMPTIFQMFCRENGIDAEVVMQAHPGVHLSWHLSQQWELRYGLVQGHFDYMVFQQAAHPCPPMEETLQDGSKIVELARAQGVKPIATITWCERRFPENQQKMYEIFDALREKTGICCSPVGQVYQRVEREEKDIDLYWVDGEHASLYGSYVIAACAFALDRQLKRVDLPTFGKPTMPHCNAIYSFRLCCCQTNCAYRETSPQRYEFLFNNRRRSRVKAERGMVSGSGRGKKRFCPFRLSLGK